MKSILDPSFKYTSSVDTNIAKTFARIRRMQRQSVDAVAEDVENYIVDVRAGKIIHKLTILMPRFETMRTSFVIRAVADFVFR